MTAGGTGVDEAARTATHLQSWRLSRVGQRSRPSVRVSTCRCVSCTHNRAPPCSRKNGRASPATPNNSQPTRVRLCVEAAVAVAPPAPPACPPPPPVARGGRCTGFPSRVLDMDGGRLCPRVAIGNPLPCRGQRRTLAVAPCRRGPPPTGRPDDQRARGWGRTGTAGERLRSTEAPVGPPPPPRRRGGAGREGGLGRRWGDDRRGAVSRWRCGARGAAVATRPRDGASDVRVATRLTAVVSTSATATAGQTPMRWGCGG